MTLALIICVFAISVGQVLFKLAASAEAPTFFLKLTHPALFIGVLVYGIATVLWVWLLQSIPLNIAYPYMGLAFLFVPIMSLFFLGEKVDISTWIGSVLIVIGVFFHAR